MGRRMTLEEIREIKQLQDQGKTTAEIMKITGRSNSTVLFWKKNEPRIVYCVNPGKRIVIHAYMLLENLLNQIHSIHRQLVNWKLKTRRVVENGWILR